MNRKNEPLNVANWSPMPNPNPPPPAAPETPGGVAVPARSARSAMLICFLVVFIDLLGFGIVLPLLPRIAESYVMRVFPPAKEDAGAQQAEAPKDVEELGRANPFAGFIVGLLMSSFSLMQFVFAPIWGRL